MTSKLTREKAQWLHGACEEAAAAGIKLTMNPNELLMFTSYVLAVMDSEPVVPIWGATKYPVSRPMPGTKLIVWDDTGKFVGYGSAVDTSESGVAIQMCDGCRFDSNHELRWQYALQPVPVVDSEPVFFIEIEGDDWINAGRIEGKKRPDLGLLPDGINYLYVAPQPAPVIPPGLHPDTQKLVNDFCTALAEKLYKAQLKYGYDADWKQDGWPTQCQAHFHQHIAKGDPRDVAAYCAFMWYHGWKTEAEQPALERDQVRREHAEWSQATFGDVGPVGPLKHLSKEALEAAADPHDPLEWADMQFLLWDAQRRMGISDEFITRAMIEKLAINKARQWPEPKDGEPRLHIKEQVAPVVPDEMLCDFYEVSNWPDLVRELVKHVEQLQDSAKRNVKPWEDTFPETLLPAYIDRIKQADEACRAAMLQAGNSPVHGESRCGNSQVNDVTNGKPLTITLPDISSKAFWSGSGKNEVFHPETYRRWTKEAIERYCAIAQIEVEVR